MFFCRQIEFFTVVFCRQIEFFTVVLVEENGPFTIVVLCRQIELFTAVFCRQIEFFTVFFLAENMSAEHTIARTPHTPVRTLRFSAVIVKPPTKAEEKKRSVDW